MSEPERTSEIELLRPPFKRSAESECLENFLAELPVASIVSYEQIAQIIEEDPQRGVGYQIVVGVRARLVKEGKVWFCIPNVGLKHANETETLELVQSGFVGIKRKTSKNQRYLSTIDYQALSNEQRCEFNWLATVGGVLRLFMARGTQKQLKAQTQQSEVDPKKILRLFE